MIEKIDITAALAATGSPAHPSHRHAVPSAPWPWVDLEDGMSTKFIGELVFAHYFSDVDHDHLNNAAPIPHDFSCNDCWAGYPQSLFPNWTYKQVVKSKIQKAITSYDKVVPCTLHRVDVDSSGIFRDVGPIRTMFGKESEVWQELIQEKVKTVFPYFHLLTQLSFYGL